MFPSVDPKQSFPNLEEGVLAYWRAHKTFEKSVTSREGAPEYTFYDGPPFATGTPHYGHILAGVLKDVVPRFWTMQGRRVERKFGWDTHGLPIENIVEKKLGISGKKDIEEKVGVFAFNEECRKNVFTYVDEWKRVVERTGRWVDMENDYKTLDCDFMESVWWVFKTVHDKGLIYESHRVVPYCPRCSTPLSNFEVNQGYENRQDKAVTVKFRLLDQDNTFVLAWTTTPWTLPANLGLAVGAELEYSKIKDLATGELYILASDRVATYYKDPAAYELVETLTGSTLVGLAYEPVVQDIRTLPEVVAGGDIATWYKPGDNMYTVQAGHHVTTDSGTGVVHIAPAYGEDDAEIGKKTNMGFYLHIDAAGKVEHSSIGNEEWVFDFNQTVIDRLKATGKMIHIGTIDHSYPHCYRCKTPLIYRAISAWYLNVESIRERMLASNAKTRWVPENIREGRFGKWLEGARDWNISRNRYWGSAIPVWKSEDGEILVIGSVEELYEYNKPFGDIEKRAEGYFYTANGAIGNETPIDIHKHYVDKILLQKDGKTFTRIPEVLDCWFESGSMPYAQKHYPFENKEAFEASFPADFICEGLDQTRGWFYTLVVLATALFDSPAFQNVIVNGILLAEDGRKMSKSLQNYPDPMELLNRHGADAVRLYLMSSPAVRAEELRFSESDVIETVKKGILPLWNTYSFFTTYANIDGWKPNMGSLHFVRHGETIANFEIRLSDGGENSPLNASGQAQATATGKRLAEAGTQFDVIVASPLARTHKTAELIAKEVGFTGEIVTENCLSEHSAGCYSGRPYDEIIEEHFKETGVRYERHEVIAKIVKNHPSSESNEDFDARNAKFYDELVARYPGKKILVVAHGGTFRSWCKHVFGLTHEAAFTRAYAIKNAECVQLPMVVRANPLDRWVMGELHTLAARVQDSFERYELQTASRAIVEFMDDLTNWYVRRSRRRFWKSESDSDKASAYETLYTVLTTLCKIAAPIIPFVTEHVYRNLTSHESVHLEYFPAFDRFAVSPQLLADMKKTKELVTLGLALRSRKKLRVRQPLASITIGENLDDYFLEILREELNVKEVKFDDMSKHAKLVCKPNARLIGPKFGKEVQAVIVAAKSGNFSSLEDGKVQVGAFVLEAGEYELAYEPLTEDADIEGGAGMVLMMDTHVTDDLKLEGYARDIVRAIQDLRKESAFDVSDRISIGLMADEDIARATTMFQDIIMSETLATSLQMNELPGATARREESLDDMKFTLTIARV